MKHVLLDKKRNYYKANMHCHTTLSDGTLTPEEIKQAYMENGYSIIAFTDHEHIIDNSHLSDESFLAITSTEIAIKENPLQSTLKNTKMKACHLNLYSPEPHNDVTPCYSTLYDKYIKDETKARIKFDKEFKRVYSARGINKIIREANKKGFLVTYNHPNWSLENATDYLKLDGLWGMEIFNYSCVYSGHYDDEHIFDEMLRSGKKVMCVCADDNHNVKSDSFGGFIYVNCDSLDYETVFSALKNGYFYASTGVKVTSLELEGDVVRFECSPSSRVVLSTEGRRCDCIRAEGNEITSGEFKLRSDDGYFRLRFENKDGTRAYTQAYDLCDYE